MAFRIAHTIRSLNTRNYRHFHSSAKCLKIVQFMLSDIGEGIKEVTLRDWFVKVGDNVKQFDDICLVESDKAAVNITSRFDGVITKLYHDEGSLALVGQPLLDIDTKDEESKLDDNAAPETTKVPQSESTCSFPTNNVQPQDHLGSDTPESKALATPAVRRIAKENNIPLSGLTGTGKRGRIMKEDILNYLENSQLKTTPTDTPKDRSAADIKTDQVVPLTGIKRAMAKAMAESHSIPSFGYSDELNVSKLVALRKEIKSQLQKEGINITYMPFFIKALSNSIASFPEINAHVDAKCENLLIKSQHNIGFAVDTPNGLLVPNIKGVEKLSVLEISAELNKLVQKSKNRTLSVNDLSGGTITISNIGIIGGTYVRPLINPPEVAIVGLGKFNKQPVIDENDSVAVAHVCNASWSADHRVIDGATLARFAELWKHYIENPLTLLLDR